MARFHDEHEREHAYRREDTPVELYQLNLRAVGETRKAQLPRHELDGGRPEPRGSRDVRFKGADGALETPVFLRDELSAGAGSTGRR